MIVLNSFWILVSLVVINTNAKSTEIDNNDAWEEFKREYNKHYSTEIEDQRREIFENNSELINCHNEKNYAFKLKMNQFGDLTHDEFIKYLSSTPPIPTNQDDSDDDSADTDDALFLEGYNPSKFDLRKTGCLSEVKNQGDKPYKTGWAFSLTGAIEEQIRNCSAKQPVESLSERYLIYCQNEYDGKTEFHRALALMRKRGIYTEKIYNEVLKLNKCPDEDFPIQASVGFNTLTSKPANELKIKNELSRLRHSVPAQVDASHESFQFYHTGIYKEQKCSSKNTTVNQAVLIVGYNENDKYWLVKNSWGKTWGEEGYMKIAYKTCGIEKQAYPIFADIRSPCKCEV